MAYIKAPEDRQWSFSFYLGQKYRDLLKAEAEKKNKSQAEILRICMDKYFGVKRK
jgi:hypothetical protein